MISFILLISLFQAQKDEPQIMLSIPPLQLIVDELVGPEIKTASLTSASVSTHTYEPTPSDVRRLQSAKILIYVDPSLDYWMVKHRKENSFAYMNFLPKSKKQKLRFAHDHSHSHHDHDRVHSQKNIDVHFWMDPLAVKSSLPQLTKTLCEHFAEKCSAITARADVFAKELESLNSRLQKLFSSRKFSPIMTTHDFLGYFSKRYGLEYLEPIEPVPGKEPSPRDIQRLNKMIAEKKLKVLFSEPQLGVQKVRVLAETAGIEFAILDPLGAQDGIDSYESLIQWNADRMNESL